MHLIIVIVFKVNRDLTAGDLDILVAQIRDAVAKLKLVSCVYFTC